MTVKHPQTQKGWKSLTALKKVSLFIKDHYDHYHYLLRLPYFLFLGESLTVSEIIERTGGSMKPFDDKEEGESSSKACQTLN